MHKYPSSHTYLRRRIMTHTYVCSLCAHVLLSTVWRCPIPSATWFTSDKAPEYHWNLDPLCVLPDTHFLCVFSQSTLNDFELRRTFWPANHESLAGHFEISLDIYVRWKRKWTFKMSGEMQFLRWTFCSISSRWTFCPARSYPFAGHLKFSLDMSGETGGFNVLWFSMNHQIEKLSGHPEFKKKYTMYPWSL